MKKGRAIFLGFICFIVGSLFSYITTQYEYLDIKTEVSVFDVSTSILGLIIGLYIAIRLERDKNRSQNFYSFIESKFDSVWQDFIKLSSILDYSNNVELTEISKLFKGIYQKINPLKTIYISSDYNEDEIIELADKISAFDDYLTSLNSQNNIINTGAHKDEILLKSTEINKCFANLYKSLNHIS